MNDEWLELLDKLTKDGHEWLDTDAGKILAERQGLLPQLRAAIFAGMENTGGSSAFGSKPPLDAGAVDLYDEIADQASQVLAIVDHHPTPYGHPENYVRLWAAQTGEQRRFTITTRVSIPGFEWKAEDPHTKGVEIRTETYSAIELLRLWAERCEAFFNPSTSREIAAPCPACGERYVYRHQDGQAIRSAALNILRDKQSGKSIEAKCGNCSASWKPDEFGFLANVVGAKDPETVIEKTMPQKTVTLSEECFTGEHAACKSVRCQDDCHLGIENHAPRHALMGS